MSKATTQDYCPGWGALVAHRTDGALYRHGPRAARCPQRELNNPAERRNHEFDRLDAYTENP
jgi:hypothetical protein